MNSKLAPFDQVEDFGQAFFRAAILVPCAARLEAQMADGEDNSVEYLAVRCIEGAVDEYDPILRGSLAPDH